MGDKGPHTYATANPTPVVGSGHIGATIRARGIEAGVAESMKDRIALAFVGDSHDGRRTRVARFDAGTTGEPLSIGPLVELQAASNIGPRNPAFDRQDRRSGCGAARRRGFGHRSPQTCPAGIHSLGRRVTRHVILIFGAPCTVLPGLHRCGQTAACGGWHPAGCATHDNEDTDRPSQGPDAPSVG